MELSEKLRQLRKSHGKTQQEVADYAEITRQAYSLYETGKRIPKKDVIKKIAKFFNMPPSTLLKVWDDAHVIEQVAEMQEDANQYEDAQELKQISIGRCIRQLREDKNLSIMEVADEFNIDAHKLAAYESGLESMPENLIAAFARYYGVDMEEVIALDMEQSRKHTVITTDKTLGRRYKKWETEIGYDHLSDFEIDEIINYTKYLVWKRKEKKK